MFQNINENTIDMESKKEENKNINIFANVFTKNNILLYIVSFMLSFVSLGGDFSIFSISMLGACISTSVPVLGIVIMALVGTAIKFGLSGLVGYIITSIVLITTIFIIKPRYNEKERNEKIKLGKNIFIATLLVTLITVLINGATTYEILSSITISIIALVFYKIFVNSLTVLQDFLKKRAFSIEEVIGASLILSISLAALGDLNIYGFGIRNILSILIVMILGWKNGILVGTTSGVTIGVTLGTIAGTEPIMIAAYAISGMIAGILSRFGRIGVIVGFILGNIVLAYVSNGYTVELIHFKEILAASIGLLLIPKSFRIDIEEFIGKSKMFPVVPERTLENNKEVAENLNHVSSAIQEIAKSYENNGKTEEVVESKKSNKQIFITELLNNLEPYKDNMLYEDISNVDGKIIDGIFNELLEKQEINRKDLLKIFADCNSYIVGFDDKEISQKLDDNILQMVRAINISYKISKENFIWQKKIEKNNKDIGKQLNKVSKAIKNMAEDIEKDMKVEKQFEEEKAKILDLIEKEEIELEDLVIRKKDRYIVEIYLKENLETSKLEKIAEILTKVLEEKIVLNTELSVGKKINYMSDDKYQMSFGKAQATKLKSDVSGDSILNIRLKDGKYLVAISDGMGSGKKAKEASEKALRMLENLLLSGFDKQTSIELINTALMNQNEELFATLDIAIVDLYLGNIEMIKSGACPTYIKNKKKVQIVKSNSLPTGIVEEGKVQIFDKDLNRGDIMVMCSDGILDSNIEYKNKELWLKYMLEDIDTVNTGKIADLIINEAIDNQFGVAKDDMSIIVCKFK